MKLKKRLEKIEEKLNTANELPQYLVAFSDQDEKNKIEKFSTENPDRPYNIIRVRYVQSSLAEEF